MGSPSLPFQQSICPKENRESVGSHCEVGIVRSRARYLEAAATLQQQPAIHLGGRSGRQLVTLEERVVGGGNEVRVERLVEFAAQGCHNRA
eukprot:524723-Prymnesium_polylepis.1